MDLGWTKWDSGSIEEEQWRHLPDLKGQEGLHESSKIHAINDNIIR